MVRINALGGCRLHSAILSRELRGGTILYQGVSGRKAPGVKLNCEAEDWVFAIRECTWKRLGKLFFFSAFFEDSFSTSFRL